MHPICGGTLHWVPSGRRVCLKCGEEYAVAAWAAGHGPRPETSLTDFQARRRAAFREGEPT